jgi:hypothetical protein
VPAAWLRPWLHPGDTLRLVLDDIGEVAHEITKPIARA